MSNKTFQFIMDNRPKDMTVMQQIMCMIYLSRTKTLKELGTKQHLNERQIEKAHKSGNIDALYNLHAMENQYAAAVAYQSFDNGFWKVYINLPVEN